MENIPQPAMQILCYSKRKVEKEQVKLPQDYQVSTVSGTQEFGQVAAGLRVHLLLRGGKWSTFPLKQHHVEINGV